MKKQKEITTGEEFTVEFIKNSSSGRPVCRIEGKIAFIDQSIKTKFIAPGSVWMVRVLSVHDRFLTVEPVLEIRTVREQAEYKSKLLLELSLKSAEKRKPSVHKEKKTYQYHSFQEIQKMKNINATVGSAESPA